MIYLHCKHLSSINRWSATRVLVLQRRWRTWNLGCCQTAISYSRAKTLGGIWFLVSLVINIIVAFIAKIVCAHSANALWQMAIQLPKLRVAVRPHHVQIPVSRSLAVTTSHPPKVGRRSQNAMIFVFSIYAKIERNLRSPASLSFSGSQRLLLPLFRMRRQFRCRMGMVPQRSLKYLKRSVWRFQDPDLSESFRIFQCLKTPEAGQGRPEVWDSLCKSTAETSESPELANAPGIWADGEYAAFRWSPVYLDFKFSLFETSQNIKTAPSR